MVPPIIVPIPILLMNNGRGRRSIISVHAETGQSKGGGGGGGRKGGGGGGIDQ